VLLHALQLTRGEGPEPARHVAVVIRERHQRAALHDEDRRVGNGLGREMMLVIHLEAEDIARQIKCLDAAPAIVEDLADAHGPADDLVDVICRPVFAVDHLVAGERHGRACKLYRADEVGRGRNRAGLRLRLALWPVRKIRSDERLAC
jgi:hypothetical protein